MTLQLQTLDICFSKPVKDHIQALYSEWLMNGSHTFTACKRLKSAAIEEMVRWVAEAWLGIPLNIVVNAFEKCEISNAWTDEML